MIAHHGEKLGGIWSVINKECKPRDLLYHLKTPDMHQTMYERDSKRMAKMVRDYHQDLQRKDIGIEENGPDFAHKLNNALKEILENQKLSEEQKENPEWNIMQTQIKRALKLAKNGTATGLDGCPYEL